MRRSKPQAIRNKLDLSDRVQVRLVKKRLRLSEPQLSELVGRVGNSLAAISKEAALQRAPRPAACDRPAVGEPAATASLAAEATISEPAITDPSP